MRQLKRRPGRNQAQKALFAGASDKMQPVANSTILASRITGLIQRIEALELRSHHHDSQVPIHTFVLNTLARLDQFIGADQIADAEIASQQAIIRRALRNVITEIEVVFSIERDSEHLKRKLWKQTQ